MVQGVGFRPFVYRLAREHGLAGWVLNDGDGVQIHIEGGADGMDSFLGELSSHAPAAASLDSVVVRPAVAHGLTEFEIRGSEKRDRATARISPDLPVCERCRAELFDAGDRRAGYPYNNCTECGPRFSIILALPYDRPNTTMARWRMCETCAREYHDPGNRRFHAQPVACPACGPGYHLRDVEHVIASGSTAIEEGAALLRAGGILALKGIGGYHLACDATNGTAVAAVRERKYRKERPFALMARDLEIARGLLELSPEAEALLASPQRPIVLAPARVMFPGVAPGNQDLGVM
ncbi:MAG: acylphosphatase, partial [Gemmatimonadaceae bacterium]